MSLLVMGSNVATGSKSEMLIGELAVFYYYFLIWFMIENMHSHL